MARHPYPRIERDLRVLTVNFAIGNVDPKVFVESEALSVYVLDGDHPGYANSAGLTAGERQEAIVVRASIGNIGAAFDTGAW